MRNSNGGQKPIWTKQRSSQSEFQWVLKQNGLTYLTKARYHSPEKPLTTKPIVKTKAQKKAIQIKIRKLRKRR